MLVIALSALLLRSSELEQAEGWKDSRPASAPQPSRITLDLIFQSRRAATRRRQYTVAGSLFVAVIGLSLAGIASWQWQQSERGRIKQTAITANSLLLTYPLNGLITAISAVGQSHSPWLAFSKPTIFPIAKKHFI